MATKATTTKKVTVRKKTTKKVAAVTPRVSITKGQAQTIANFYSKNGKKAPAFLLKSLV